MNFVLQPWQLLFLILAGWVHREQQDVIDYLRTENQVLKEKLGYRRILLSDDQRRRLAVKGKLLGRKLLEQIGTLVTPDTILRWHRQLIAEKWDYSARRRKKPGRPAVSQEIKNVVVRLATENPTWGYDRLQGALANLGHDLSDSTVANILREHGIEPAPERKRSTTWNTFIKAHWQVLAAIDFTTIEVWTHKGLVTLYLFFAMEPASRRVDFAGLHRQSRRHPQVLLPQGGVTAWYKTGPRIAPSKMRAGFSQPATSAEMCSSPPASAAHVGRNPRSFGSQTSLSFALFLGPSFLTLRQIGELVIHKDLICHAARVGRL